MKKSCVFVPEKSQNAGLFLWGGGPRGEERPGNAWLLCARKREAEEGKRPGSSVCRRGKRRQRERAAGDGKYLDFFGRLAGFAGENEGVYQRLQRKEMENR